MLRLRRSRPPRFSSNIYLELSTSYSDSDTVSFLVDGAGADRVLFGSDMPEQDVRHHVGRVLTADISRGSQAQGARPQRCQATEA